jgi:hypothetical protein
MASRHRLGCLLAMAALLATPAGAAEEDKDLDLIPQAAQTPAPAAAPVANPNRRNDLEDAFAVSVPRGGLAVPAPPPAAPGWEDRLFLDSRDTWQLADTLSATYSGRFNLRAETDIPFPNHEAVRNELREAFVSWHPADSLWLDLGRINVKNGVAAGANPTDFFRSRSVVEPLTADPRVQREDRLGTLMLLAQAVWPRGELTAAFAPKVTRPTAIYTNLDLPSVDPMLDRTNAADRLLLKGSLTVADGVSPELLFYHEGTRSQVGANLTLGLGQATVGYVEWAGGVRPSLIDDALRYGRTTGTLPSGAPSPIPENSAQWFQNDVVVGASYILAGKVTLNVEYHYNQAGFSAQDWRNWFAAGSRGIAGLDRSLWYLRGYAQDQQQTVTRHSGFVRADWVDAFVPDLELTALASVDLHDGSGLAQATADYYLSRAWTVGGLAGFTFGGRRSDFGSLPTAGSVLIRLVRYL